MRYFRWDEPESEIAGAVTYVEADDGCAMRQVTAGDAEIASSNRPSVPPPWGGLLGESHVDYDELLPDPVAEIAREEFEGMWARALALHADSWREAQRRYPVGAAARGAILVFYPQGVLVQLDGGAIGVADDEACRASCAREDLSTRHLVSATVAGHDHTQQWVVLGAPHVHTEEAT